MNSLRLLILATYPNSRKGVVVQNIRLSISGTYSAGKTSTALALSHLTGIPKTLALTIREIMPAAVPGKALSEVTPAEYLQLAMRRHTGRAAAEAALSATSGGFISDGSSLQEWIYGAARVHYGMDPSATTGLDPVEESDLSDEMRFFGAVVEQFGVAMRQHVAVSFDAFVHLENERAIAADGHRPMNEGFRRFCDDMLIATVQDLGIVTHRVSGTMQSRLEQIVSLFGLPTVMSVDEAIAAAGIDYSAIDKRLETERSRATAPVLTR